MITTYNMLDLETQTRIWIDNAQNPARTLIAHPLFLECVTSER